jgi:hypothetical protein
MASAEEVLAKIKSILAKNRARYGGIRTQMLAHQVQPPQGGTWRLTYGRITAIPVATTLLPSLTHNYGTMVYEESHLSLEEGIKWISELLIDNKLVVNDQALEFDPEMGWGINYEDRRNYRVLEDSGYHISNRLDRNRAGVPTPGLVLPGLPVYPNLDMLAHHRFGVDRLNDVMFQFDFYLPSYEARIEGMSVEKRRVIVKVRRTDLSTQFTIRVWWRAGRRHSDEALPVVGDKVVFKLPAIPERVVAFLVDDKGTVIEEHGNWMEDIQEAKSQSPEASWRARIDDGEGQTIEFKNYANLTQQPTHSRVGDLKGMQADKLAVELAAFANTNEGSILIGVDDDGNIHGVDDIKAFKSRVTEIANGKVDPPLTPKLAGVVIKGKPVLAVTVKRSVKGHMVNNVLYIRRNASCRPAKPSEIDEIRKPQGYQSPTPYGMFR